MSVLGKKDNEEVAYIVECDDEMLRMRITLVSGTEITPALFLNSLIAFVDNNIDDPKKIFEEMGLMQYSLQ